MITTHTLPKLITFDGEARSGKGTIVSRVKDCLRDEHGYRVMLIDAGQVFRCLVVAATNRGVDMDDPTAIDRFLGDEESAEACVQFVKAVYHMEKIDRDALLYSSEIGVNSAKIGARPLSQEFKDRLLRKWLRDAGAEGFEIVLLDGRALEEVGKRLEAEHLCTYILGFYFICDPNIGALRTLGFAADQIEALSAQDRKRVEMLASEIVQRNQADAERDVQPIVPPVDAPTIKLPDSTEINMSASRHMAIVDTSAVMTKDQMTDPIERLVISLL